MEFRILGPLQALDGGRDLTPAGSKRRALLALLLVHANETVPTERLIDELWGDNPPSTAARTVQAHVSRLRKALGNGAAAPVVTRERGYQLTIDPERVDSYRFERLVAEGKSALASGRALRAASTFESALSLWRGSPLADLAGEPFAQREIARLEDLRMVAIESLNEVRLALGRHAELVGQLEALIGEHPYRERLRAQLMLALYRCDRQADALQAYQDARRTLVGELGIEPGQPLRDLEQAILAQDPALAVAAVDPAKRPTRLPASPTRTLGRDRDRDAIAQLLRGVDVRLVTLTGPGGVGKTRLALEVARRLEPEFPDGGWFVSLAATAKPEHVPSAIAQALGVTPLEAETPKLAVERFLAPKDALVVLDNLEHLLPAAPLITNLLSAGPALTLLATSREALRLQAEHRYPVAPLDTTPANALFIERARRQAPDFMPTAGEPGAVAEICRRLDGLPLAIELAAARTALLGVEDLNERLAEALDVLGPGPRDAPARQQTLRATIDWSHRLLNAPEREAFARFAVFGGGATTDAAEAVTGADLNALQGLVDKQLLLRRDGPGPDARLLMLETVREYARERLEADRSVQEIHRRHCEHYLALAERAEPQWYTHGDAEWTSKLAGEVDNFRAALDWSIRHGDPATGLRLAGLLNRFWVIRNLLGEGMEWIEEALVAAGDEAPVGDRARARRSQVYLLAEQGAAYNAEGRLELVRSLAEEALALSREAGDPAGIAEALLGLASLEMAETQPQRRRYALAEEALACAREAGDDRSAALALFERTLALPVQEADAVLEEAASALRDLGSARILPHLYSNAAYNAIKAGSPTRARPLLDRAVPLARELGEEPTLAIVLGNVGLEALFSGDLDRAEAAFHEQLRLCRQQVMTHLTSEPLGGLAAIETRRGELERAARLLGAATAIGPVGDADVKARLEEHFFAAARQRRGARAWSQARENGAQMSFEEAIGFALNPA
jgi:predicted ATPase/DNA-binding SARP family transcriptional activator